MRRHLGCVVLLVFLNWPNWACGRGASLGGPTAAPQAEAPSPIIYFAMTDRFANGESANDGANADRSAQGTYHGGDLAGLKQKIPYLADLGVDVLWISPVVDNIDHPVAGAGFQDWAYHGYWAKDFESIDEHLGTEEDLALLIQSAHRRGMQVLLDVVLNHPGYGSRFANDPAWTRAPERGDCGDDPLTECLLGLPDFRTEDPAVADWLVEVHLAWARRSGADGFRVDSARHIAFDVLEKLAARARRLRPDFLLIGEIWGAAPGDAASAPYVRIFDALFDFSFGEQVLALLSGAKSPVELSAYLAERGPNASRFVVFLDTHDTPGFLFRLGGDEDRYLVAAALQMTVPGMPLIYYGDEVGRMGGAWPRNRSDMPWSAAEGVRPKVVVAYQRLIRVHHALNGPLEILSATPSRLAYRRGTTKVVLDLASGHLTIEGPVPWSHSFAAR